ncbi:hypothetical protein PU560_00410, partial [Georgenia sp. 10Sc9-8]|nr:hypothetical protein [Georgenia halotolerans]
ATLDTLLAVARAQDPRGPDRPPGAAVGADRTPSDPTAGTAPAPAAGGREAFTRGPADEEPVEQISTALDHDRLRGVAPATLEDGTPIPFGLFAQLACESRL